MVDAPITIFTPIEMVEKLKRRNNETEREYIDRSLVNAADLRRQATLLNNDLEDYREIMRLYHKHTVKASCKMIDDILLIVCDLIDEEVQFPTDVNDYFIVMLRLLQFIANLSQAVVYDKQNLKTDLTEFSEAFNELLLLPSIKYFLGIQFSEHFANDIFRKISYAFSLLLLTQYEVNDKFQQSLRMYKYSEPTSYSFAVQFWTVFIGYYDSIDADYFDHYAKLFLYCFRDDPKFLQIYYYLNDKSDKMSIFIFLNDYIEKYFVPNEAKIVPKPKNIFCLRKKVVTFVSKCFAQELSALKLCDPATLYDTEFEQFGLMAMIINVLSSMVKCSALRILMRAKKNFMEQLLELALYMKVLEEADETHFKPLNRLRDIETRPKNDDEVRNDPRINFKSRIIKIISNLAYQDKECQDLIREKGGIEFLLENTCVDQRNSFIQQWSIFSLSCVTEGNTENQAYIASTYRQDNKTREEQLNELKTQFLDSSSSSSSSSSENDNSTDKLVDGFVLL